VYAEQKRLPEAEAAFRKAIEDEPGSWSNHAYYGWFLTTQAKWESAEGAYRCALDIAPENPSVLSSLSGVYAAMGRAADGRAALERSIAIYPTSTALSNLATLDYREGRFADAAKTYEKATELNRRDYRIWRNLAVAYRRAGEPQKMLDAYRNALELARQERQRDPKNGMLVAQMADCHAKLGNEPEARSLLAEAEKLEATKYDVPELAAGIYEDMGDRDAALRLLGVGIARGLPRESVEKAATFDKLRADPRYQALVARVASGKK
jgi:Flp pilus assembly protein TadD